MRFPSRLTVVCVASALVLASCAGGGGGSASGGATSGGGASSGGHAAPSKAILANPCLIVTVADVQAVYGGQVTQLPPDKDEPGCSFEIEGQAKAGKSIAAGEFGVSFDDEYIDYAKAKVVFGDAVQPVDGLGTPAVTSLGFIHAKVGAGEIIVGGVFVGDYDREKLAQEHIEMTKLLLTKF